VKPAELFSCSQSLRYSILGSGENCFGCDVEKYSSASEFRVGLIEMEKLVIPTNLAGFCLDCLMDN
jgi:hypothetical protein